MDRRRFKTAFHQQVYDGYIDQDPEYGCTPFGKAVDQVYDAGLRFGVADNAEKVFDGVALAAHYAGADLHAGIVTRGTSEVIDQWVDFSGHIKGPPNIIFAKNTVKQIGTRSRVHAIRFFGEIHYSWGSLPGHRFPADARAYDENWVRFTTGMIDILQMEKASFNTRKHTFQHLCRACSRGAIPEGTDIADIYRLYGELGLLRRYFRDSKWNAVIIHPDMQLAQGMSHMHVNGEHRKYLLCMMDDAIQHKMSLTEQVEIHDLMTPVRLPREGAVSIPYGARR